MFGQTNIYRLLKTFDSFMKLFKVNVFELGN